MAEKGERRTARAKGDAEPGAVDVAPGDRFFRDAGPKLHAMTTYPLHTHRDGYRGNNASRREKARRFNEISAAIERHINQLVREQVEPVCSYMYGEIAADLNLSVDDVREACCVINGGYHGFTARRPEAPQ